MSNTVQTITRYVEEVNKIYSAGNATEHSYRPALKTLLEAITSGVTIKKNTNVKKEITDEK